VVKSGCSVRGWALKSGLEAGCSGTDWVAGDGAGAAGGSSLADRAAAWLPFWYLALPGLERPGNTFDATDSARPQTQLGTEVDGVSALQST
jgi:hypothetical protein